MGKDSFVIKGYHATVGYVEALRRPLFDTHSALVDMLLDAGAVLYCKTNVPQTMMVRLSMPPGVRCFERQTKIVQS